MPTDRSPLLGSRTGAEGADGHHRGPVVESVSERTLGRAPAGDGSPSVGTLKGKGRLGQSAQQLLTLLVGELVAKH